MQLATDYVLLQMKKLESQNFLFTCITHNDAHAGNIVFTEKNAMLIDFEYSGYNYNFYDICCYFAEFTGIDANKDHISTPLQRSVFFKAYFNPDVDL